MQNIKTYRAVGAIAPRRLIIASGTADGVAQASGVVTGLAFLGVSEGVGAPDGRPIDVIHSDIALVEAGAAVARSAYLTSDSQGRAVTAAPAAGVNGSVVGYALETAAAAGDLIRVFVLPSRIQG